MASQGLAVAVVISYLLIRFGLERRLDALHDYGSLIFDLFFSVLVAVTYRSRIHLRLMGDRRLAAHGALALGLGWVTYRGTLFLGLPMPFDFNMPATVFLLLVAAPLLEEFLYRLALWKPFEVLFPRAPWAVILATSALFSFGHFWGYFLVPPELKTFVLYQTVYTFILSLWWGRVLLRYQSVAATMILHFLYNLGFYWGFRTWGIG